MSKWMRDFHTKHEMGPASEEFAERFEKAKAEGQQFLKVVISACEHKVEVIDKTF